MAKYNNNMRQRQQFSRNGGSFLRQFTLMLLAFICGYLFTSVYDYEQLKTIILNVVLDKSSASIQKSAQVAVIPKPKLEFYTLLTKEDSEQKPSVDENIASAKEVSQAVRAIVTHPQEYPPEKHPEFGAVASNHPEQDLRHPEQSEGSPDARHEMISSDQYMLQLASFRRPEDAQKMRASLLMKGFTANITPFNQQGSQWFRVTLGPFSSKMDAERIQGSLARSERIVGMIRKIDA